MEDKNLTPFENNNENTEETIEITEVTSAAAENDSDTEKKEPTALVVSKKKKIIIAIIAAVLVAIACGVAIWLVGYLGVDTSVATPDESTVETTATQPTTEADGTEDTTWPDGTPYDQEIDWDALQEINSDIKGWITVRETPINYPVLKSEEDGRGYQYYLHRYYDKTYDFAGSIFIDYRSPEGVDARNVLMHGHNMNNGSMFAGLLNYGGFTGDLEFYKKSPTLFFNSPEGNEQWIIFSVFKTNTLESHGDFFNYLMGSYESDAQFMNYVYNVKIRSLIDVPVPINEDDQILTLSTCSYEYSEFRTVVCARKLRNNEKVNDYIDNATVNENAVWPEVYYYNNGGTRPEITTFKTELQAGNLDWYDGKGDLSGNEWLVTTTGNKTFTVTFVNYDGSIISTQTVAHGKAAVAPADPVKPDSANHTYVFKGWGIDDYLYVDCNMTVAPVFEAVPK